MMISQTTHDTIDGVEIGNRDLPSCIRCCESHTQFHSTFHTLQATYERFPILNPIRFILFALACGLLFVRLIRRIPSIHAKFARWKSLSSNERQEMSSGYNKFTVRRAHTLRGAARRLGGDASKQLLALP